MLVIGTFEHRVELEQALLQLEYQGVPQRCILAVPMAVTPQGPFKYSGQPSDLSAKSFEVGMACATAFSVLGISAGFVLEPGPILCGILAAVGGFFLGQGLYRKYTASSGQLSPLRAPRLPEVTVIVRCSRQQVPQVAEVMWKHHALTVGEAEDEGEPEEREAGRHKSAGSGA
ncbi:hypothetical protein [Paenibacillus mucilaginosus]|uniref:Uncharacterized protein n=1 Tax=Paenibacillus mucilaginosus (strain KNP414) TaxID=1036673 RepID=F8FMB7_PAEMK|nr:hypothetical protein [Paenibacillus mucilaginosus]AEI38925.1 hypothetical protein KNP414_00300 [Paenibacillus mucilaginosus KNP414]MCG7216550.1 hypothetical protein [Paenibacillus mucilaginosus]WDM27979.1 hypothetical protein KCX80_01465 [Paenibacillus mucilaginosus]